MFRGVIAAATISAMLWHALIGCCAHHCHVDPRTDHSQANAASEPACSEGCWHTKSLNTISTGSDSHAEPHEIGHSHFHPISDCAEADCNFTVGTDSERLVSKQPVPIQWYAEYRPAMDRDSLTRPACDFRERPVRPLGDLRLHLALGVLTI